MNPQDLLREGELTQALDLAKSHVRSDPSNGRHRILLFQLYALIGELDKAMGQLDVIAGLDAEALPMVQTYREALRCEALRRAVFAGQRSPMLLGDPPPWVAWIVEALRLDAEAHHAQARELREKAFDQVEAVAGLINDTPFEWIADADSRIGPLLEAIVNGRYYWIPFHQVRSISLEAPADLRDLVWTPAYFTWANGGEAAALIPTRYPGSELQADSRLKLSRLTAWQEQKDGDFVGYGQKQLITDSGEFALLDVRSIALNAEAHPAPEAAIEPEITE